MSRYVTLSRDFIINAIEKESKLEPGQWIDDSTDDDSAQGVARIETVRDCARCAVGAVLTRALHPSTSVGKLIDLARENAENAEGDYAPNLTDVCDVDTLSDLDDMSTKEMYDHLTAFARRLLYDLEQPMIALSAFFEGAAEIARQTLGYMPTHLDAAMDAVRDRTVAFVRENFPETVEVYIDGASPAEDVSCRTE